MFANINENHKSYQPNMSKTGTRAGNVAVELSQSNGTRGTTREGIQHTKARLRESLRNGEAK